MIITIGREHGSNGHDIARELARQLEQRPGCPGLLFTAEGSPAVLGYDFA